jgi:nicotinamidase/pyrazinamidase
MRFVLLDIDTQYDFLCPEGKLYVPGAENIHETLVKMIQFAAAKGIKILSTVDAHKEYSKEFQKFPAHCIIGTKGQKKLIGTVLYSDYVMTPTNKVWPKTNKQLIFEKDHNDPFTNGLFVDVIDNYVRFGEEDEEIVFLVMGVALDICVKFAIEGLQKRNADYIVISDAVRSVSEELGRKLLTTNSCTSDVLIKFLLDER